MKKILILILLSRLTYGMTVYDPANHQQSIANHQMMVLQRMEMIKQYTEAIKHTQNQITQLKNDGLNLSTLTAGIVGKENQALLESLVLAQEIAGDRKAILNNSENLDGEIKIFQDIERLGEMSSEQLEYELKKVTKEANNILADSIKYASKSSEKALAEEERRLKNFTIQTSAPVGSLQAQQQLKQISEDQSKKLAQIEVLLAEQMKLQSILEQVNQSQMNIEKEELRKFKELPDWAKKPSQLD